MINITNLSVNFAENVTKVTLEVYETKGSVERLRDKLVVNLTGRYQNINDDLYSLVNEELVKNGFNYNQTVG